MSRRSQTYLVESIKRDGTLVRRIVQGVRKVHAFRAKKKIVDVYKLTEQPYLTKGVSKT